MQRLVIVAAIAIGILAGSDCLTIQNGKLINRCGIWQLISNSSLVLVVEKKKPIVCYSGEKPFDNTEDCLADIWRDEWKKKQSKSIVNSDNNSIVTNTVTIGGGGGGRGSNQYNGVATSYGGSGGSGTVIMTYPQPTLSMSSSTIMPMNRTSTVTSMSMDFGNSSTTIIYCGNNNTYNHSQCVGR